jgi:hypothetical protein
MLKNIIRKKLVETKTNKKYTLTENRIIKSRFNFLFENRKIRNRKDLNNFYILMLSEMVDLYKKGYSSKLISENAESLFSVLNTLFNESGNSVVEVFKQKGIDWLIQNLNISGDDELSQYMKDALNKTELNEVARLFSDCEFLSKKIAQSIKENYINSLSPETEGSNFMKTVKTSFSSVIQNSDIETRLESTINSIICPLVDQAQTKFEEMLKNMKSQLVAPQLDTQV